MLIECSAKYASTSEDDGALGAEVDAVGGGTAGEEVDEGSSGACFFFLSFFERLEGGCDLRCGNFGSGLVALALLFLLRF